MKAPRAKPHAAYRVVSALFGGAAAHEAVTTTVRLDADPGTVWDRLVFYEEVPDAPSWILRALLPHPVRTEGDKRRIGAIVRCAYSGGNLAKRITAVDAPRLLRFEVVEQHLGIEGCIVTRGGSYHIQRCGAATDVALITHYEAYLRPRSLWRPVEAFLVNRLHRHILSGIRAAILHTPAICSASQKTSAPSTTGPGAFA
jgi:hypothetical protein